MSRIIQTSIFIEEQRAVVFKALMSPSSIKQWWSAQNVIVMPEEGGIYALTWGQDIDSPEYITVCRINALQSPKRLVLLYEDYRSQTGQLPFEASFLVEFNLIENVKGTLLLVTQSGFPDDSIADDYYEGCQKGWNDVLGLIKKVVEK